MRCLVLAAVLLAAGCVHVADPMLGKPPRTAMERTEYDAQRPRLDRVSVAILTANGDLCAGGPCRFVTVINAGDAIGASAATDGKQAHIFFSLGMMRFLKDDGELAHTVGHEWAHYLLGHSKGSSLGKGEMEYQADCVGALLAARAGYRVGAGRDTLNRIATSFMGGSQYPDAGLRATYLGRVAAAAHGRTINRETIKQICGVAP